MRTKKIEKELLEALGKRQGETKASKRALIDYAMMEKRSLSELNKIYKRRKKPPTKRLSTLKTWSSRFEWQKRVIEFDKPKHERILAEWDRRKTELREQDWQQGQWIRSDMFSRLQRFVVNMKSLDKDQVNALRGVVAIMAQGGDWQRLATHEPTSRIEVTGAALDAIIENELARVGHPQQAGTSGDIIIHPNADT